MRSEISWSYISDRPVFVYDTHYDAHLCYWNGVAMTRAYALIIIGSAFFGIFPSASQRAAAWKDYLRVYKSGAFATREWDDIVHGNNYNFEYNFHQRLMNWITKSNSKFFVELRNKYTPQQALSWLKSSSELVANDRV